MEDKIVRAHNNPEKHVLARQMRHMMTPAEDALWQCLRNNKLLGLHFRRQQVIEGFIADFYCREARLIIECDGSVHETRHEYDKERDQILAQHNLRILRITNSQIKHNLAAVLSEIAKAAQYSLAHQHQT